VKKIVLCLAAAFIAGSLSAQTNAPGSKREARQREKDEKRERINALARQEEEGEIVYNKHSLFNIKLATDGYGIGYEFGKFKASRKSFLYQFELSEKKHPKEKKQAASMDNQFRVNSVVYGKTNNFYQFKLGVAQQQVIGGKGNKNGVSVSAIYGGGLTLGMLKPYLVDALDQYDETIRSRYPQIIDSNYYEMKAAGVTKGWNEMKLRPGLYAKTAMRFDYGRLNETITAIEVGLGVEYYSNKISQMAYNKDKQFFFNAYLAVLLGKRK